MPCRLYVPRDAGDGVVVHLHGGGFVFNDVDVHDGFSRRLANRSGVAVLSVDYRRPPEHRFPAAVDDALRRTAERAASGTALVFSSGGPISWSAASLLSDDALVRRFESVRRPHPMQGDGRLVDGRSRLLAGLRHGPGGLAVNGC